MESITEFVIYYIAVVVTRIMIKMEFPDDDDDKKTLT